MKWFNWVVLTATTTISSAFISGVLAYQLLVAPYPVLPGSWVQDRRYDPELHADPAAFLERERVRWLGRAVYLEAPREVIEYRMQDLGLELDVAEAHRALVELTQTGNPLERLARAVAARRGLVSYTMRVGLDRERARRTLTELKARVYEPAVNAKLDVDNHRRVESQEGRALDIEGTLGAIEKAASLDSPVVELGFVKIEPEVTSDMLADIDVSKVLASFETSFRNKAGRRAINIRRAAAYLDGTILAPGATFSFNQVVGPRSEQRGFTWAPVIVNDELEEGVGGGVCQVATTLHAAVIYGLLDVKERRSHSRPSGYAPLGLDATVIDGKVDLKFTNPYDTPLMVHAYLPSRYTIRVELLGREAPGKVKHVYAVTEKHDFVRRVASKPFLEPGQSKQHQKGIPGYDVVSVVSVEYPDGTAARKRSYKSKYYPVPEVYWVPEGSDLSELPELPEGATHTEHVGDGAREGDTGDAPDATLTLPRTARRSG